MEYYRKIKIKIRYVEKDLNNRIKEFDSLCEMVDFKKFEKEVI
jgi:hypothetical protein